MRGFTALTKGPIRALNGSANAHRAPPRHRAAGGAALGAQLAGARLAGAALRRPGHARRRHRRARRALGRVRQPHHRRDHDAARAHHHRRGRRPRLVGHRPRPPDRPLPLPGARRRGHRRRHRPRQARGRACRSTSARRPASSTSWSGPSSCPTACGSTRCSRCCARTASRWPSSSTSTAATPASSRSRTSSRRSSATSPTSTTASARASASAATAAGSLSGLLRPDEVEDATDIELPDHEDYDTVAGLVMRELGKIPEPGDRVEVAGARPQRPPRAARAAGHPDRRADGRPADRPHRPALVASTGPDADEAGR